MKKLWPATVEIFRKKVYSAKDNVRDWIEDMDDQPKINDIF